MNLWDIAILAAIALLAIRALHVLKKRQKSGGCSCGNCSCCMGSAGCSRKEEAEVPSGESGRHPEK